MLQFINVSKRYSDSGEVLLGFGRQPMSELTDWDAILSTLVSPETPVSDATFIDLDAPEPSEPTREIPVGGILEALAGTGTVRSAAMAVKEAPMITADPASTRVFRRISEDAEERARLYEQPEAPAAEAAEAPAAQEPSEEPLPEKSIDDLLAELRSEAAKAAESIPEEKSAEEAPEPEAASEEQPAEDAAQVIEELPQRPHVAGAADAELLATKYDLEEELAGLEEPQAEEQPAAQELPAEEQPEAQELPAEEQPEAAELPAEEQPEAAELPAEEKPLEVTQQFDPALTESKASGAEDDDDEDEDDDDDDEEVVSKHIFLKIVIAILIVCAVFELAVFGFSKLAPDAGATQALVQIEEAIRAALASAFEAVKGLFGGR